jgi:hypothetical protein
MLMPRRFTDRQHPASRLQRGYVGGFCAGVGDGEIDVDHVLRREAGHRFEPTCSTASAISPKAMRMPVANFSNRCGQAGSYGPISTSCGAGSLVTHGFPNGLGSW